MNNALPLPATMVWQILRKDVKLLWPLALGIAIVQVLVGGLLYRTAPYHIGDELAAVVDLLCLGLAIAIALLIVLAVQHDALPSVDQDWLVRPIKRRDLLLAKLLGVLLLIHAPIITVDLLHGLAEGFSFARTLRAVLLGNLEVARLFTLPFMAIAALTKSVTEALVGFLIALATVLFAALLLPQMLLPFAHAFNVYPAADAGGVAWVWESVSSLLGLAVIIAVLLLQYFRRCTHRSRMVFLGGVLLSQLLTMLPWQPAFSIQQWLSTNPQAHRSITLAFDPTLSRQAANTEAVQLAAQIFTKDSGKKGSGAAGSKDVTPIFLPLRISGLPAGLILHADRSALRLIDANGTTLYLGVAQAFDLRASDRGDAPALVAQSVPIPAAIYQQLADQMLRLELDYSLTLLRQNSLPAFAADGGHLQLPDGARCASRLDSDGKAIEVGCRTVGELPPCLSMQLEQTSGARRNPETFNCAMNYEPAALRFSLDLFDQNKTELPFRDTATSARYPIDETQWRSAQIVVSVYEPEDHFQQRIDVAQFRLRDWQTMPPAASDKAGDSAQPVSTSQP
jgi:hypothetical protein